MRISTILTFLVLLFSPAVSAQAQEKADSILIGGTVSDAFTRENLLGVEITVSDNKDFAVTVQTEMIGFDPRFSTREFRVNVPHAGKYTLTLMKDGYATKTQVIDIPERKYMQKVRFWQAGDFLINKQREQVLGEATVTASRIMMVERGDTIVYNASAFQLAEGSMLDALIAQLPGVKLEAGGRITVNGKFVESLLVNGKDFFKGDPKVALDNLPAYMVNNVKVYQREPDEAYLMGERAEAEKKQDPWVIDIGLKRQYSIGWVANAEAGYGSDNRYLGRLFGLRFTNHSRLALYGSTNNVNHTGGPSGNGDWAGDQNQSGDLKKTQAGVMFNVDGKKTKIKFNTSVKGDYTHNHDLTHQATTQFLSQGDVYGRSFSDNRTKDGRLSWDADLRMPFKRMSIRFSPDFSIERMRESSLYRAGSWNENPYESYRGAAIDSLFTGETASIRPVWINSDIGKATTEKWDAGGTLRLYFRSPLLGRWTNISFLGKIGQKTEDAYSQYLLYTTATADRDFRNRYTDLPERNYRWLARLEYEIYEKISRKGYMSLKFNYDYEQRYRSESRQPYRLDRLADGWDLPAEEGGHTLGMLPSTHDALFLASDWANAYRTLTLTRTHNPELVVNMADKKGNSFQINLPVRILDRSLRDFRNQYLTDRTYIHKKAVAFEPSLNYFSPYGKPQSFSAGYHRRMIPASLASMVEVRDENNPLYIRQGNNQLKDTWEDRLKVEAQLKNAKLKQMLSAEAEVWMQSHAVGLARTYDAQTGVTTVMPRNVDGNWGSTAKLAFERGVGKQKRLQLGTDTRFDYVHSVDFTNENPTQGGTYLKSTVNTVSLTESLKADYRKSQFHAGLRLSAAWNHARSARAGFADVDAVDIASGLVVDAPLVWGINLSTDITLYNHRGYNLSSANTDNLFWNATFTRSFLRGKNLILKLTAYDIFASRSSLQYRLNAQGQTETWTNSMRRYVMLSLIYRLNKEPKRK